MTTPEFEKLYKGLNPAQKKAVDTVEGAVMVVAGPGTGKTTVLTLRIAKILLETQINPENILALTFTENAAHEMRKRLLSIIGQDAYRVEITTFHSFCNLIIKKNQEEFSEMISSENINELEQLSILEKIMESLPLVKLRPLGDLTYYVKHVLSAINELKRENISPDTFEEGLKNFEEDLLSRDDLYHQKGPHKGKMKAEHQKSISGIEKNKELLLIFAKYQKEMKDKKKYDYNDMLLEVIEKFKLHPYLLQYFQEKFHYFLIDEHQDTNAAQNKIVELLVGFFENPNLFVVGDEKQAIFRFQGATLENFLYFKDRYKDAVLINLSENYRSSQTILDATFSLISQNKKTTNILSEEVSLVKKASQNEEKINIVSLPGTDLENYWIVNQIKKILPVTSGEKIAVLGRNNKDLDGLSFILNAENIPFIVQADNNILNELEIEKLIILLRAIHNPKNLYINRVLLFDYFEIEPLDAYKIIRTSHERKVDVWSILTEKNILSELKISNLNKVESFIQFFTDKNDGFISKSENIRMDELFVEVLQKSGLLNKILTKPNAQDILSKIIRLYDEIKEGVAKNHSFSLAEFLKFIDLLEEHNISLKDRTSIAPDGYVRLMTVHKSKGLEFDFVFVVNSFDGHWGNQVKRSNNFSIPWEYLKNNTTKIDQEDINSDERRLFYVAMTRARKNVFLTYSSISQDGKEQIQSQFITEIPEEHKVIVDTSEFEKELLSHKERLLVTSKKIKPQEGKVYAVEYVREIFKKNGLSVSALNNYLECPWKYFFMNLIRVPEKIQDAGLFGNAIHASLNQYIVSLKKGIASKNYLLSRFREELSMQSITPSETDRFIKRGEDALNGFYENTVKFWVKDIESELDVKGIRINDNLILNGKIDMIEPIGKTGKFCVYDFKTGKAKSRNEIEGNVKNGDGNYKRQLIFYKILLDRYKNGFYKMDSGVIEFVEPTEKGEYKKEIFEIDKKESEELLKNVIEVGEEIINLSFWDKKCDKKDCEYCRLRDYMG